MREEDHERRVSELLEANNREVERRRADEAALRRIVEMVMELAGISGPVNGPKLSSPAFARAAFSDEQK